MWISETKPMSEKQAKYLRWQANVQKAKDAGKARYAAKQMSLWTPEQKAVLDTLEKLYDFYKRVNAIRDKEKKCPIPNKDLSAISFAVGMYGNVKEWGKPLSVKQVPFVDKAYAVMMNNLEKVI